MRNELGKVTNRVYEGQVSKGVYNGNGQMVYPNGDVYKGVYKNGQRCGTGICIFGLTGSLYKGEWRDDKPVGNGILFTLPNEIIEGRFDGYKIVDGQVKILLSNGEFYEGNFRNNMRNATGIHYYLNGDFYDGEWQRDRRVGRGRLFHKDGSKLVGVFADDKLEGKVDFEDAYGNLAMAEDPTKARVKSKKNDFHCTSAGFVNGKLYSQGKIEFKSGDKYKGAFKDGRPCGKEGVLSYGSSL